MIVELTDKFRLRGNSFQWILESKGKTRDGQHEAWNSDATYNGIGSALSGWFEKELRTADRTVTLQELMLMLYGLLDGPERAWKDVVAWVGRLDPQAVSTGQLEAQNGHVDESALGLRPNIQASSSGAGDLWVCYACGTEQCGIEQCVKCYPPEVEPDLGQAASHQREQPSQILSEATDLGMTDEEKELWG